MGDYFLSVASSVEVRGKSVIGPASSAFSGKRPDLADDGLRLSFEEDGLYQFGPPRASPAHKAVAVGDAADTPYPDLKTIITQLRVA